MQRLLSFFFFKWLLTLMVAANFKWLLSILTLPVSVKGMWMTLILLCSLPPRRMTAEDDDDAEDAASS